MPETGGYLIAGNLPDNLRKVASPYRRSSQGLECLAADAAKHWIPHEVRCMREELMESDGQKDLSRAPTSISTFIGRSGSDAMVGYIDTGLA